MTYRAIIAYLLVPFNILKAIYRKIFPKKIELVDLPPEKKAIILELMRWNMPDTGTRKRYP